jgi:cell division septation protein DedD
MAASPRATARAGRVGAEPAPSPVASRPAAREAATPPAVATNGAPSDSWVVQVHALRDRNAADVIVKRLVSKGYPAFLASAGPAGIYRVQVGRFADRQEAERTRERLKNEEKFDPWITH